LVVMSVEKMPELSSVSTSLRIPPIWRDKIRLWFAQFEAIMSPQKKGDQAMFELVTQPHGTVAAVTENPTFPRVHASIEDKIDMLTREIAELKAAQSSHRCNHQSRRLQRSRSSSRYRPHPRQRDNTPRRTESGICYYHRKFGKEAQRCT
ncbi:hypothetical protein HW555_014067, partial [Spodoptera exigua]